MPIPEFIIKAFNDEMLQEEYKLTGRNGETTFFFERFGAVKGDEVLDKIRIATDGVIVNIATLPREFMLEIQRDMFSVTFFTNRIAQTRMMLYGAEETAFDAIGAAGLDIKHILMRSIAVNFIDSFSIGMNVWSWFESLNTRLSEPTG